VLLIDVVRGKKRPGSKGIEEGREELLERRKRSPADFSDQGRR
jgi:hypothetical protein